MSRILVLILLLLLLQVEFFASATTAENSLRGNHVRMRVFSENQVRTTPLGEIESMIDIFLRTDPNFYTVTTNSITLSDLAIQIYGSVSGAPLLAHANRQLSLINLTSSILQNQTVTIPCILFCVQFSTIDCVQESYSASQGSTYNNNYWTSVTLYNQRFFTKYLSSQARYIYFIMSYLRSSTFNPNTTFAIQIANSLDASLTAGNISFVAGYGPTFSTLIPSNGNMTYQAQRSNALQGIHGFFQFSYQSPVMTTTKLINVTFIIYSGVGGTFSNSVQFASLPDSICYSNGSSYSLNVFTNVMANVQLSSSPNAILTVSFSMSTTSLSNIKGWRPLEISSGQDSTQYLESTYSLDLNTYLLQSNIIQHTTNQGWRFIPILNSFQNNNYRIINSGYNIALQASFTNFHVVLAIPDPLNQDQIWQLLPSSTSSSSALSYMIKSVAGNFCVYLQSSSYMKATTVNTNNHPVVLEKCDSTVNSQLWSVSTYS